MKVMHINCTNVGSTGSIMDCINAYITSNGHEWRVCFSEGTDPCDKNTYKTSFAHEPGIYARISFFLGCQYGFAPISTMRILSIIRREKPDVVHLHSINCKTVNIYRLIGYLKRMQIATVLTNHAEFFYTGSCAHAYECNRWMTGCGHCPRKFEASKSLFFDRTHAAWRKMKHAFAGFDNIAVVSVSDWGYKRSIASPILNGLLQYVISNGVDTEIFQIAEHEYLREKYGIPSSSKVIIHVTASFSLSENDKKGGRYVAELAQRLLDEDCKIIVIGETVGNLSVPPNVILAGRISNKNLLAGHYSLGNLTLITSKRETFSMPCAESLCCGTPVVGFFAGGPETIAIKEWSRFCTYGDMDELEDAVRHWLNFKNWKTEKIIASAARSRFASTRMAKEYLSIYDHLTHQGVLPRGEVV